MSTEERHQPEIRKTYEGEELPTNVQPFPKGPLLLRRNAHVVGADGSPIRSAARLALCRCGHSQNKPYCDLSHQTTGFGSEAVGPDNQARRPGRGTGCS